ncbi:hypothetical protein K503DRAFT_797300 [Rhizopogon vinicolor AM-OR11-026]|uniref:Uncharacterized protein n=1 Tax=Rhizopogon vinicolor AM-OR11-026 TaxID=1314800 RepID=A0A1B7NBQ2_9AGAM|nr:hypothetical protein K503DRAFT_797300 [Rhizopogon vinicolor AM-OR11-026]
MASNNNARMGYSRRTASSSSSREFSPVARRQKQSFTPNFDDGDHVTVVDIPSRDDTPAPLISSWQPSVLSTATINPQAVLPSYPMPIRFVPGYITQKRKKTEPVYHALTNKFSIIAEPTQASTPAPSTQPILHRPGPYSSIYRYYRGASATKSKPSVADAASPAAEAPSPAASYTIVSTPHTASNATQVTCNNIAAEPDRSRAPAQVGAPATNTKNKRSKQSTGQRSGSSARASVLSLQIQNQPPLTAHHQGVQPPHSRRDYENSIGSQEQSAVPPASAVPMRPLRMLTILIEDVRNGVLDHQLTEVQVQIRLVEDPDGCLWANAKEICEQLQAGPSRIDGPARVYTLHGQCHQFFMRVGADNILEAEPCNLGVSKECTLEVVVEAPPTKGQLSLPSWVLRELLSASSSDSNTAPSPSRTQGSWRPIHSGATCEPWLDPLSQCDYRSQKRKRHSENHSSTHHKSLRSSLQGTPSLSLSYTLQRARQSRHADIESSSDEDGVRELSLPIFGRLRPVDWK